MRFDTVRTPKLGHWYFVFLICSNNLGSIRRRLEIGFIRINTRPMEGNRMEKRHYSGWLWSKEWKPFTFCISGNLPKVKEKITNYINSLKK